MVMEVILCSPRGFCAGVVRAIQVVEEEGHGAGQDVDEGGRLAEPRRKEGAALYRQVDDRHRQHDQHVAADYEHRQPDRQPVRDVDGSGEHEEGRYEQQLVCHRIEQRPEAGGLAGAPGGQPVEPVRDARNDERDQRPAVEAVQDQNHQTGDQNQTDERELVGDGQGLHNDYPASRRSAPSRFMASTASEPLTDRVGWNVPSVNVVNTPAETELTTLA